MPNQDFYALLGVTAEASAGAIKSAYRRLAMRLHPDAGDEPDAARFREVHDAYTVLSDAARRHTYDVEIGRKVRVPTMAEEFASGRPIGILDDFESVAASPGEILHQVAQNFFGFHQKSGAPRRRLSLEIVLSPEEALSGGRLPLEVPCYEPCLRCDGVRWMWGLCPLCHGFGLVKTARQIALDIAPGIKNGSVFELPLDSVGISNLALLVTLLVA